MDRRPRHKVISALLAAFMLMSVAPAMAQNNKSVDEQVAEIEGRAKEAYDAGQYAEAIRLITQANQLRPHPNYLVNIAFTYAEMKDCTNARIWAQNALDLIGRLEEPNDSARAASQNIIDTCIEDKIDDPNKGNPVAAGPPEDSIMPYIAWPLLGVGLVGLSYLSVEDQLLLSRKEAFEQDCNVQGTTFNNSPSCVERHQTLKDREIPVGAEVAAFTVTGLMVAAGAGMLIYEYVIKPGGEEAPPAEGDAPAEEETSWRVAPMIGPGASGFLLEGRF